MKHFALKDRATGKLIILHSIAENFNVNAAADLRNCDVIQELKAEDLPANRDYREAWTIKNNCVGFDCQIVQETLLNRVRTERAPKLELLHKKLAVATLPSEKKELRSAIVDLLNATEKLKGIDFDLPDLEMIRKLEDLYKEVVGKINGAI